MEDVDKYFNACLEEYKTLREESKQASINMISSMTIRLGTATIATIAGISFLTDKIYSISPQNLFFPLSIFCVIVPFLLLLIYYFLVRRISSFKTSWELHLFYRSKNFSVIK